MISSHKIHIRNAQLSQIHIPNAQPSWNSHLQSSALFKFTFVMPSSHKIGIRNTQLS